MREREIERMPTMPTFSHHFSCCCVLCWVFVCASILNDSHVIQNFINYHKHNRIIMRWGNALDFNSWLHSQWHNAAWMFSLFLFLCLSLSRTPAIFRMSPSSVRYKFRTNAHSPEIPTKIKKRGVNTDYDDYLCSKILWIGIKCLKNKT